MEGSEDSAGDEKTARRLGCEKAAVLGELLGRQRGILTSPPPGNAKMPAGLPILCSLWAQPYLLSKVPHFEDVVTGGNGQPLPGEAGQGGSTDNSDQCDTGIESHRFADRPA